MLDNPLLLLGLAVIAAAIPVVIWLFVVFRKEVESKKTIGLVFGLGCLTAPALLGLQYLWDKFPRFNLAAFIENSTESQSTMYIMMFMLFGALEEIIKMYVVKIVDDKTTFIRKINDAIRYSIVAALAFSFVENIYYLYEFFPVISKGELIGMYIFRSIFTACAHMIFSGVFGYFYGIGKFSMVMTEQSKLMGKINWTSRWISKAFNLPLSEGYRQKVVVRGLITAILMHATFNFLLQFSNNQNKLIVLVVTSVIMGYLYLRYLLKRKAGSLVLLTDPTKQRKSTMAKTDESVVEELLGMWFTDKKYVDVIHVCERLLERDPDNSVVKLFKAKAMDEMEDKDTYKKILSTVIKTGNDLDDQQKNVLSKYTKEKEMFQKVKRMIEKQLKKEQEEKMEFLKAKAKIQEQLNKEGKAFVEPLKKQ